MSVKQNIKETIKLLCDIINHHGQTKMTPETLRLAKFNKNEATEAMWRLLYETTWFLNTKSMADLPSFSETDDCKQEIILYVKHELCMKGYCTKSFYSLPEDMSYGSRDVLLAYGWLISHGKLLHFLIDNYNTMLQEYLPCSATESSKDIPQELSDELPSMDTLLWLLGHFRLQCNGLYSAQSKLTSLVTKVHCATRNDQRKHLSVLEVFLLRHPKELVKFQEILEQHNSYLESLLRFFEQQSVFWKWMKSVHEAKLLEYDSDKVMKNVQPSICVVCKEKATKRHEKVTKTHSEIQDCLRHGELLYKQVYDKLQSEGYSDNKEEIKNEIAKLTEQISRISITTEEYKQYTTMAVHGIFPELRQKEEDKGNTSKNQEPTSAKQAINWLKEQISQLDIQLLESKNLHFKILNDLASNIQDVVCIPPIESSKYFELKNK